LQGCPASGLLFVMAIDPFYRMLNATLTGSRSKAFADDLATILATFGHVVDAAKCFEILRVISELELKTNKCVMITLGRELDDQLEC
jgi:hypothetical protein